MRQLRLQCAEIFLVDDAAAVQHHDAIGVDGRKRITPGHRSAIERGEGYAVEIIARSARATVTARRHRAPTRRTVGVSSRMTERPAPLRELIVRPVSEADRLVGRGRKACIQPSWRGSVSSCDGKLGSEVAFMRHCCA